MCNTTEDIERARRDGEVFRRSPSGCGLAQYNNPSMLTALSDTALSEVDLLMRASVLPEQHIDVKTGAFCNS